MSTERANPEHSDWVDLAPEHLPRYLWAAEFARNKTVLDAGCGAGYGAAMLKSATIGGARHVVGVDVNGEVLRKARHAFPDVEFIEEDGESLALVQGKFDLICAFECIEHLAHPERFLETVGRRLAPGACVLISTPDRAATPPFRDGRPANPYHTHEWFAADFTALLERHFRAVEMRTQVESHGVAARREAVDALRQGLMWSNPVMGLMWRKFGRVGERRSWKALDALTARGAADYPIVMPELAALWGRPHWHVAICRQPRG